MDRAAQHQNNLEPTTVEMGQSRTVTLPIFPDSVDATEGSESNGLDGTM
jgi:hypothetical protein